jgi:hypothetical protein
MEGKSRSGRSSTLDSEMEQLDSDNFSLISSLVLSMMHPISRLRLETHVVDIRLKELPNGFRVLSAKSASIESFPEDQKIEIRSLILYNQTNHPELICNVVMFEVRRGR